MAQFWRRYMRRKQQDERLPFMEEGMSEAEFDDDALSPQASFRGCGSVRGPAEPPQEPPPPSPPPPSPQRDVLTSLAKPEDEAPPSPQQPPSPPAPPPPTPEFSRYELRKIESDGNTAHCWEPIPAAQFQVRGPGYLKDGQKMPSAECSELLAMEVFRADAPAFDVAARPGAPAATLGRRTAVPLASVFVVNMIVPAFEGVYQVVFYFGIHAEEDPDSPAARLLQRFLGAGDSFRGSRLRVTPCISEGPWAVRKAVGTRPAILGRSLRQRFVSGTAYESDGGNASLPYLEVDVECNSSLSVGRIVSLVTSSVSSLVIDLCFVVEAQGVGELPERVLGSGRVYHVVLNESVVPSLEAPV